MSEADLARKVIQWLSSQHWDIYQEVQFTRYSGRADIVAVRDGKLWIIETKTTLSLVVLGQASSWKCHYRSVAVPASRRFGEGRGMAHDIARHYLNIGILEILGENVSEPITPKLMREYHELSKKMINQLKPEHKTCCEAGSNGGGYWTPYRDTIDQVRRYIAVHPGCTLKEIMNNIDHHHYSSNSTAIASIRIALSNWEANWCEIQKDDKGTFLYFVKSNKT